MKGSSLNIEKIIHDSAAGIEIDQQFKKDLKKRIMASAVLEERPVIELPRRSRMPYMKVAGWVLFAALSGSTIWGAGNLYSHMVAINNPVQTQNDNNKSQTSNIEDSSNKSNPSPVDPGKNVASADTQGNSKESKTSAVVTPTQPAKTQPKTSGTQGTIKPQQQSKPSSGTAEAAAPTKPVDTPASTQTNTSTTTPTETEPVNKISLTMESGRYIIKNISVTKSEIVPKLPEEYKSLTADEWAKLPIVGSKAAYEKDGSVYMVSHVNDKDIFIDKGKTPVLYESIGLVSYIKDTTADNSGNSVNGSEVWVFDSNSANKYNVLSSEDGKYSYLNMFWSQDGKSLYVLEQNNATKKYDLVKLTIDIQ